MKGSGRYKLEICLDQYFEEFAGLAEAKYYVSYLNSRSNGKITVELITKAFQETWCFKVCKP